MAILPIGFFAVGATLAEGAEHGELPLPPPITRPVALAVVARLALVPGLLMLLAAPLIDLPSAYRLMSAMPTGLNAMVVSHAYGLDNRDRRRGDHLVDRDRGPGGPGLAAVLALSSSSSRSSDQAETRSSVPRL